MKIALLVILGLVLGALGGAALGVGAGLAWVEIFNTTGFEGYSGMLVFFTFMPLGAAIGGLGGAFLFGVIAIRDSEIAVNREPAAGPTGNEVAARICAMQNCALYFNQMPLVEASNNRTASRHGVADDAH
jgi:hypothetical protein